MTYINPVRPHPGIFLSLLFLVLLSSCAVNGPLLAGSEYTSPNRMFSVKIPKAKNWAGVPYSITVLDTKGDNKYDKVLFHVDDFGQYLVASARVLPSTSSAAMDNDDHRTVLRNISRVSLMAWRSDFQALPHVDEESFFDTKYGEALLRVYGAKKGSHMVTAKGGRPAADDTFDTNIASIVARKGAIVIYVLAQDDSNPDNADVVIGMAKEIFNEIKL